MANLRTSCHVFLSFEGETRNTFTCFLYESLKNEGFKVFMDEDANGTGDKLDSRIQEGIKTSMSAIVVFSKNYASSTCCLDELLLVLERNKTSRYFILPIFYDVNPAEIRHHTGSYHTALTKHEERHHDKVDKWRQALKEVANIRGEHVHGRQSTFIQNIVDCFRHKLSAEFPECLLPSPNIPVTQENPSCASPGDKSARLQIEPNNASGSDTSDLSSLSECKEVFIQIVGKIVALTIMVCAILFLIFWSIGLSNMIKSWPDF